MVVDEEGGMVFMGGEEIQRAAERKDCSVTGEMGQYCSKDMAFGGIFCGYGNSLDVVVSTHWIKGDPIRFCQTIWA